MRRNRKPKSVVEQVAEAFQFGLFALVFGVPILLLVIVVLSIALALK